MPQSKKKAAAPVAEIATPTPEPPKGHRPPSRWIRTTARWQEETDDSLPFSAEIDVAGLTTAGMAWIYEPETSLGDLWGFLAGRVRAWNALALDQKSGEWRPAPGPEELGWKALALVDQIYTTYLVLMVNDAIHGGDARADEKKVSASPDGRGDAGS